MFASLDKMRGRQQIIFGTDFSYVEIGVTPILETLTRNSPHLVLLEVSKVDTLFAINSESQFVVEPTPVDNQKNEIRILSKVVSVLGEKIKNRYIPMLKITLKHMALQRGIKKVRNIIIETLIAPISRI